MERGFEAVTLAEIAAGRRRVGEDDLQPLRQQGGAVLRPRRRAEASVLGGDHPRAPGTTVLQALRALLAGNRVPFARRGLGRRGGPRARRGLPALPRDPGALARRCARAGSRSARSSGRRSPRRSPPSSAAAADDPALRVLVAMLVAVLHLRNDVLSAVILARVPPDGVRREVTRVVDEAFDRLHGGVRGPRPGALRRRAGRRRLRRGGQLVQRLEHDLVVRLRRDLREDVGDRRRRGR